MTGSTGRRSAVAKSTGSPGWILGIECWSSRAPDLSSEQFIVRHQPLTFRQSREKSGSGVGYRYRYRSGSPACPPMPAARCISSVSCRWPKPSPSLRSRYRYRLPTPMEPKNLRIVNTAHHWSAASAVGSLASHDRRAFLESDAHCSGSCRSSESCRSCQLPSGPVPSPPVPFSCDVSSFSVIT